LKARNAAYRAIAPKLGWVVERIFAWLGKCRRLATDWERTVESAEARVLIAHIRRMTR